MLNAINTRLVIHQTLPSLSSRTLRRAGSLQIVHSGPPSSSRRLALLGLAVSPLLLSQRAALAADDSLDSLLPDLPPQKKLPKAYVDTTRKLANALIESIELEETGANELEVRRKADPVKDLVREFLNKWRDSRLVQDEGSFQEVQAALKELGAFYMKNGQRSALTKDVSKSVLGHLRSALDQLPPEEEKKFLGLF